MSATTTAQFTATARSSSPGTFDPSACPGLTPAQSTLVQQITSFTETYFQNPKFDASHDFKHVMRVVRNAIRIFEAEKRLRASRHQVDLDLEIIILAALLHDVEDKKYAQTASQDGPLAKRELMRLGVDEVRADKIQSVVDGVSYSSEIKDPSKVTRLIEQVPELAIVQDADRLDAIGAIGIGRCFAFGGARSARSLGNSVEHFGEKLLKLEEMMKTQTGGSLAATRTARIRDFMAWWDEEAEFSGAA